MNTTLREALARRASDAGLPNLNIEDLVGLGEARLRRRRLTAVLGSAAAVIVVIVLVLGASLHGPVKRSQEPVNHPTPSPNESLRQPVRNIVYSDTQLFAHTTGTIHFGDRVVDTGDGFVHMDVTDDGFVYTTRGGAWFSDGGTPEQIGSHLCGAAPDGEFGNFANRGVMSANSGSLVAWFECARSAPGTLVVYDTASRRTLARREMAVCGAGRSLDVSCTLFGLTSGRVYFNQGIYKGYPRPEYEFDVTTGRLNATTRKAYAADISSQPRGLVVGDDWHTGTATDGIGASFRVVGSRLVLAIFDHSSDKFVRYRAFDTATRQAVQLHLPSGYRPHGAGFTLFEWLGDQTVALFGGGRGDGATDILTCHLSDGRCVLAVTGPPHTHDRRIVPHLPLPG